MTTFCELRMEGKSTQSRELAEKIVQQIQFQDWSDIVQQGTGAGSSEAGWYLDYDWLRLRTESDRRRWLWYRDGMRQQQQQQQQQQQYPYQRSAGGSWHPTPNCQPTSQTCPA